MPPITEPGEAIRVARFYRRMSQVELAKKSGLPQSRICLIEKGLLQPSAEQAAAIWRALST